MPQMSVRLYWMALASNPIALGIVYGPPAMLGTRPEIGSRAVWIMLLYRMESCLLSGHLTFFHAHSFPQAQRPLLALWNFKLHHYPEITVLELVRGV
jgi:hypothetical protein